MDGFNGILDIGQEEDLKMMKGKLIGGKNFSVDFIIKKLNSKNKDSKKIRQILLHWCYEMEKPSGV